MRLKLPGLFFIVILLFFAACKKKQEHMAPKVMQKVLMDVQLAEAYSNMVKDSLHKAGTKNFDSLGVYYKNIFAHYNITSQQFIESLDWYKNHPVELDSVYSNMMTTIAKWQSKAGDKALH